MNTDILIINANELATLSGKRSAPRCGDRMKNIGIIKDGAIAVKNGKIIAVGSSKDITKKYSGKKILDAGNKLVTPGLIDPHTHVLFTGTREDEFEMRILGKSYKEISIKGGGIKSTVKKVRGASKEELIQDTFPRLDKMIAYGTTSCEIKSGYGLSTESEIKMLEAIKEISSRHPIDIIPTFMGAHEIPEEYKNKKKEYIKLLINEMIPEISKRKLAEFCDIFCEDHVFNIAESEQILKAAEKSGFLLKIHADELCDLGGAELAGRLKATSADHLIHSSKKGISAMKKNNVIAVLLPGTNFSLGLSSYAPARKMIENGLALALATDCNPGTSYNESMQIIMALACTQLKMLPSEALTASTINAAFAVNRGYSSGSIEIGKKADILIWDIPTHKHIPYHYGVNLVKTVIKDGKVNEHKYFTN